MYVLVRDVVDAPKADVRSSPSLETDAVLEFRLGSIAHKSMWGRVSYLAVQQSHILNPGILNDILDSRILSNTSHADTVGIVAPQVLHENVGCVGLGREAVITDIDAGVGHTETVHVEGVKSIGVLGQSLRTG